MDLFTNQIADTRLIKQVHICSLVNQQLCSLSVTSLRGSQEWGCLTLYKTFGTLHCYFLTNKIVSQFDQWFVYEQAPPESHVNKIH